MTPHDWRALSTDGVCAECRRCGIMALWDENRGRLRASAGDARKKGAPVGSEEDCDLIITADVFRS